MTTTKLRPPPARKPLPVPVPADAAPADGSWQPDPSRARAPVPALADTLEDDVFYPDSDGEPLPDGMHQDPLFREIVSTLEAHLGGQPNTLVSGNTFIYYERGNPRKNISPDCYVAFDVDVDAIMARNIYLLWEVGKAPDFVLEIASKTTADEDTGRKALLYAAIGFGEYWLFDNTGGDYYHFALEGRYLGPDGAYHLMQMHHEPDGMIWAHSRALGLDLCWDQGRLRFYDPARGEWLPNFEEAMAQRQAAEARLDTERSARENAEAQRQAAEAQLGTERSARANAEARRQAAKAQLDTERSARENAEAQRQAAEARVAELEAELRRLRGDADTP